MELKDLIGERLLTGVDFGIIPRDPDNYMYDYDDANTITFVLDGRAYLVTEDGNDGYRSSHKDIVEVPGAVVKNTFEPVRVLGRYREKGQYGGGDDILELIDIVTTKTVLEVGTENNDDYYPSYVANFTPENMASNVGK